MTKNNTRDDKTIANIALAATQPQAPAQPCPSAEKLASLADGRLRSKERAQLLEHFDACQPCYHQWLQLSSLAQEKTEQKTATILKLIPRKVFWSSTAAVAIAACLVLVIWRAEKKPEIGMLAEETLRSAPEEQAPDSEKPLLKTGGDRRAVPVERPRSNRSRPQVRMLKSRTPRPAGLLAPVCGLDYPRHC